MRSRREFLIASSSLVAWPAVRGLAAARPRPSRDQLDWQRDELALFIHFGVNTFTNREWGDGTEDPSIFNPTALDARQWARTARTAGARALVLTAKHHDGFCLWPSALTDHTVAKSPWRDGRGDLVREFVDACRAEGLKAGLYLSPWDRHEKSYGDSARYNDFYAAQLTELLTHYGRIDEVWFDGANGEGPNGKKQTYDWPRVWKLTNKLQPHAIIFSDAGPGVRWIGNENGVAGETNWSTVDPSVVPVPGTSGAAATRMMQHGDPNGNVWRPGETDVSIRPGWFHHPAEDARVRSVDNLVNLYFTSVGRNSKLLLNVPPTSTGLIHATDIERLTGMRTTLDDMFGHNFARGKKVSRRSTGRKSITLTVDLGSEQSIGIVDLREDITDGQCVSQYRVEGSSDGAAWVPLSAGTTIGYRKLDRVASARARIVRLTVVDAVTEPSDIHMSLFA